MVLTLKQRSNGKTNVLQALYNFAWIWVDQRIRLLIKFDEFKRLLYNKFEIGAYLMMCGRVILNSSPFRISLSLCVCVLA